MHVIYFCKLHFCFRYAKSDRANSILCILHLTHPDGSLPVVRLKEERANDNSFFISFSVSWPRRCRKCGKHKCYQLQCDTADLVLRVLWSTIAADSCSSSSRLRHHRYRSVNYSNFLLLKIFTLSLAGRCWCMRPEWFTYLFGASK